MIKFKLLFIVCLVSSIACKQHTILKTNGDSVQFEDLNLLLGEWTGTLTYLDYRTNKPFTMPANLLVEKGSSKFKLLLKNSYPNEPSANDSDKLTISKDGTLLNNQPVISRKKFLNGEIQLITQQKGKDNNKKALIRHTYLLSNDKYSASKEVQFKESTEWILRSEFSYNRE